MNSEILLVGLFGARLDVEWAVSTFHRQWNKPRNGERYSLISLKSAILN
jgi:hypothetical protein